MAQRQGFQYPVDLEGLGDGSGPFRTNLVVAQATDKKGKGIVMWGVVKRYSGDSQRAFEKSEHFWSGDGPGIVKRTEVRSAPC